MDRRTRLTLIAVPALGLMVAAGLVFAPSADAAVSTVEAESMHAVEGYGTTVGQDDRASGGRMLVVDSDVSVRTTVTLDRAAVYLQLVAHTDHDVSRGALTSILIDGVSLATFSVNPPQWRLYSFAHPMGAGRHELVIRFRNAPARNLYLDVVQFYDRRHQTPPGSTPTNEAIPAPTGPVPVPTTLVPTTPVPTTPVPTTPAPTRPAPTATTTTTTAAAPPPPPPRPRPPATTATTPPRSSGTSIQAYVTGYSWFDNTPPGSSDIAFPVIHTTAGGTGTYLDPITMAVGHIISGGRDTPDWPAGTRFYIPNLRRYFMVEDACGDGSTPQNGPCHQGFPGSASTWVDLWVGGQGGTSSGADDCMDSITDVWTIIKDPAPDFAVVAGDIYGPPCSQQFGNTAVRA